MKTELVSPDLHRHRSRMNQGSKSPPQWLLTQRVGGIPVLRDDLERVGHVGLVAEQQAGGSGVVMVGCQQQNVLQQLLAVLVHQRTAVIQTCRRGSGEVRMKATQSGTCLKTQRPKLEQLGHMHREVSPDFGDWHGPRAYF